MAILDLLLVAVGALGAGLLWRHPPALARLRRVVTIDTRSLAVFRGLLGLLIAVDALLRLRNLTYFYADGGVVPRYLARALISEGSGSILFAVGDPRLVAVVLGVTALVGLQLLVGYRTRLATVLALVLVASIDARNILVLSYADILLRLLLFWAIFLPLGARWSVDARQAGRSPRRSVAGLPSALILLQLVFVLLVNAVHKAESGLWRSGEAMPIVLGLDDFTYLTAELLRELPRLLQVTGFTWYLLLWFSPLLLVLVGRSRALYLAPLLVGHLLLAATVRIGAFPFVSIAGLLLFVQAPVWEDARRLAARLAARWPAVGRLGRRLGAGGRRALDWLAVHLPSRRLVPELPEPTRTVAVALVVLFLVSAGTSMVAANLETAGIIDDEQEPLLGEPADLVETAFLVEQPSWTIFAPSPRSGDYYYVFPAVTTDGQRFDLYTGGPVVFDRPMAQLHRQYPTYRHRFYMTSIRRSATTGGYANAHVVLAEYYCDRRRGPDGGQIAALDMYVVREQVTMETLDRPGDRQRRITRLYAHDCGSGPAERPPVQLSG